MQASQPAWFAPNQPAHGPRPSTCGYRPKTGSVNPSRAAPKPKQRPSCSISGLRRFGPATETDIAWWFGWTAGLTRKTLTAIDATVADVDEGPAYVASGDAAPPDDPGPWVRLLPGLDATTMGWKKRDWYVDPAMVPRLFDRNGNAGPTVWADGQIVGGWIQRPDGKIAIELARGTIEHPSTPSRRGDRPAAARAR